MGLEALIFDVDGTLAETERAGHRMAFNNAFAAAGLDWFWDEQLYGELLSVGGGRERIEAYIRYYQGQNLRGKKPLVDKLHKTKAEAYVELMEAGEIPLRPGIARLIPEAKRRGLKVAIATNSSSISLGSLIRRYFGCEPLELFDVVVCGDDLENKKPAPDAYAMALERLGVEPQNCIAFEDSQVGLRAADIMQVPTVVTVSEYTTDEDFEQAALVVSDLGERESPSWVLDDPYAVTEPPCVVDMQLLWRLSARVRERRSKADAKKTLQPAARATNVQPFKVMQLLADAKVLEQQGVEVIHLEVGEPDFQTPYLIKQAAQKALAEESQTYTPAAGMPALREKIATYYQRHYGVQIEPQRVIVTPGASGALQLCLAALVTAGDEVLVTEPGYPCNEYMLQLVGAQVSKIPLSPSGGYKASPTDIKRHWEARTRGLLLASPANPTGSRYAQEELQQLADTVSSLDGWLLNDEIYHGFEPHGSRPYTALQASDERVFVVNSFSKYFAMTGWRLGWAVVPSQFVDVVERLAQNLFLAPSTIAQSAALAAFEPEVQAELQSRAAEMAKRREYCVDALSKIGFRVLGKPEGAFYLWLDISTTGFEGSAEDFCQQLLIQQAVALTPGNDFVKQGAENTLRLAYAQPLKVLEQAVARIEKFLRQSA